MPAADGVQTRWRMSGQLPILENEDGDAMKPEKILRLRELLDRGQYRIDPYAIADAIIRWAGLGPELGLSPYAQMECSKPASGPSVPAKQAAAGPSTTDPIHVRPAFAGGEL